MTSKCWISRNTLTLKMEHNQMNPEEHTQAGEAPKVGNESLCRYLRSLASDKDDTGEKAAMLNAADEIENLDREVERWKKSIIPFLAVHAGVYGRDHYGECCMHFTHYDLLKEAGGRMDDFKRSGAPTIKEPQ